MAHELADAGCRGLVSFGIAGGLTDARRSGDVVLADRVMDEAGCVVAADAAWLARATQRLKPYRRVRIGPLVAAGSPVATPEAKRRLGRQSGAEAVDMESHAVALVALDRGLPFLAVRAIADTARHRVPPWLTAIIDESGRVSTRGFCRGLMMRPGDLPDIARLAVANRRALRSLRRVAALLGGSFALL